MSDPSTPSNSPRSLTALASAYADMTAARTSPDAIRSMTFRTAKKGFDPDDVTAYLDRLAADVEVLHNRIAQLQATVDEAARAPAPSTTAPFVDDADLAPLELRLPGPPVAAPAEPEDQLGERVAELIRMFEENVRAAEESAKEEADALIAKARGEADDIRREARLAREEAVADAAAIVSSARSDADRMQSDAQARAEELEATAERLVRDAQTKSDETLRAMSAHRDRLLAEIRDMRVALADTLTRVDGLVGEGRKGDQPRTDRLVVVSDVDDRDPVTDDAPTA